MQSINGIGVGKRIRSNIYVDENIIKPVVQNKSTHEVILAQQTIDKFVKPSQIDSEEQKTEIEIEVSERKEIKVVHLNICGLRNKEAGVYELIQREEVDTLGMCETFLNEKDNATYASV